MNDNAVVGYIEQKTLVESIGGRMALLPEMFGVHGPYVEGLVYAQMQRICEGYCGGYWHYYRLSNGGFLMVLDQEGKVICENESNYFEAVMSVESASIVASLYALNIAAWKLKDARVLARFNELRDFASTHPESDLIFAAID